MLFALNTWAVRPPKKPQGRVYLIHADRLSYNEIENPGAQRLAGNVHFRHDGMDMFADSAVFFQESNSLEAFGKVRAKQGDTLSLNGDYLFYNGSSGIAEMRHNVVMKHRGQTLLTDSLNYDRLYGIGYYFDGGILKDGDTQLMSDWGEYHVNTREAQFNYNVNLTSPRYRLVTDTMRYDARTKWAEVLGPSNIFQDKDVVYTEHGFYNTDAETYRLMKASQRSKFYRGIELKGDSISNFTSRLEADSIAKDGDWIKVFGHVEYLDRENKSMLLCDFAQYNDTIGQAMATGHTLMKEFSSPSDTLFAHADTLRLYTYDMATDSLKTAESDSVYRVVYGYYHARAYRSDLQVVSDSLVFNLRDKQLHLFRDPIVWNEDNQILGEEIHVFLNDSTVDSIYVDRQALLVQQVDSTLFNQVTGKQMRAYFTEGEMQRAESEGNVCIVYYPLEKDSSIVNMTYAETALLKMFLKEKKMQRIWAPKAQGTFYPISQAPADKSKVPNFAWFDYVRPRDKYDLFDWRPKSQKDQLKAVPRRVAPVQHL
ncbi:MAG: hypothetical protein IJ816_02140 [Alloprevotella sp.]|nr:hypothetical protein [Alloprevotella sp.]